MFFINLNSEALSPMDATPSTLLPVISSVPAVPTVATAQTTAVNIGQITAVATAVTAAVVAHTALDHTEIIIILNQIVNIV